MKSFVLVLNAGSSSLKYALFSLRPFRRVFRGHVDGIGASSCHLRVTIDGPELRERFNAKDHLHAVLKAFQSLKHYGAVKDFSQIKKIGHRVVHGGEYFSKAAKITPSVLKKVKALSSLAPLHNPPAIAGILASQKIVKVSHYAVFDTAFHHTIPKQAFLYGIPLELYEEHKIRKYGFHGISHSYVSKQARKLLQKEHYESHEIISCHLGNGSSITAIKDGKSMDTSMGFTPLDGLIMGTRSGELDPEILIYLLQNKLYSVSQLDHLLNKESGFKGIVGSSDIRDIHKLALQRDEKAMLVLDMLSYRVAKYIGGYASALKGLDAIVFTGGIGENAYYIRKKVCSYLSFLGVSVDLHKNRKNETFINTPSSKRVLVIPTNEERGIAEEIRDL